MQSINQVFRFYYQHIIFCLFSIFLNSSLTKQKVLIFLHYRTRKASTKIINDLRPPKQNVRLQKWRISANSLYSSISIHTAFVVKQKIVISQQKEFTTLHVFLLDTFIQTNLLETDDDNFVWMRIFCSLCSLLFCLTQIY